MSHIARHVPPRALRGALALAALATAALAFAAPVATAADVTACGTTISEAGTHALVGALDGSALVDGQACITIAAAGVTLEGGGSAIAGPGGAAVGILVQADDARIEEVDLSGWSAAVRVESAQRAIITRSTVIGAFELDGSTDASIFDNRLIGTSIVSTGGSSGTTLSVAPAAGPNIIGGPQLGGNFWSDAPVCADGDADGFCDAAHTLDASHADARPLAPRLRPSAASVAFGDVGVGTTGAATVTLVNQGSTPLDIASVSLGGADAALFAIRSGGEAGTLAAGAQRDVAIDFSPQAAAPAVATLTIASDDGANPALVLGLSGVGVPTKQLDAPVTDGHVRHVGGTAPTQTPFLRAMVGSGLLQMQLWKDNAAGYELADIGADATSTFEINLTVDGFTPRLLLGAGKVDAWTRTQNDDGTWNVSVVVRPVPTQSIVDAATGQTPPVDDWPTGDADRATQSLAATVQMAVETLEVAVTDAAERERLVGAVLSTDAQAFSGLRYDVPAEGKPTLSLFVAAPHLKVDGGENTGFYEAILPQALLDEWQITSPGMLAAAYDGATASLTATPIEGGMRVHIPMHYSSGTVSVGPDALAPTAAIAPVTSPLEAGASTTFSAAGSTDNVGIVSYSWDMGDGTTLTGESVSHAYAAVGERTVTLTVTDAAGNTDDATLALTVQDTTAPTAAIADPGAVGVGASVGFDGSGSTDNVGVASYAWSFGDGATATGAAPQHTFANVGKHTVTLTVTDAQGLTGTTTREVDVRDLAAPTALIAPVASAMALTTTTFDGSGSTDNLGVVSYTWDFGDGATGTGATPTHTYAAAGIVTVTLTVADAAGNTHTATLALDVQPASGVLSRAVRVTAGTAPTTMPYVESSADQLLQLSLRESPAGSYDLTGIGADATTVFEITLTVADFTPRVLIGAGKVEGWSVTTNEDGTRTVVVTTRAVPVERIEDCETYGEGCTPTMDSWPTGDADRATRRLALAVQLAFDALTAEVEGEPVWTDAERAQLDGATITTDAQMFGSLEYRSPGEGIAPQMSLFVAAPHLRVDGTTHDGFYEAFLPQALLDAWGVAGPSALLAAYQGAGATLEAEAVEGGMRVSIPLHYSAGSVTLSVDATPPTASISAATASLRGNSVTFDGSGSTDDVGVVSWSWDMGDGTTLTGASVSHAYAATGFYTVTLTVADAAGNTASAMHRMEVGSLAPPPPPPPPAPPAPAPEPQPSPTPAPQPEPDPADERTTNATAAEANGTPPAAEPPEAPPEDAAPPEPIASPATLAAASERVGVPLDEPFRALDATGDGRVDAFEDPTGTLAQVRPPSDWEGRTLFLVARAGEAAPLFLWDASQDAVIDIDLPEPEIAEVAYEEEAGLQTVTVHVAKGEWIYFEIDDPDPDAPLLEIRAGDGRVIPPDRVWRTGGKIAVLDDPDTVYEIVLAAPPPEPPAVEEPAPEPAAPPAAQAEPSPAPLEPAGASEPPPAKAPPRDVPMPGALALAGAALAAAALVARREGRR